MKLFFNALLILIFLTSNNYIFSQSSSFVQIKNDAISLMNDGRYGEAIDLWNKFISENPHIADGYNLRGVCYEKQGNYEFAVYNYRTAKKLSPDNVEITSNLNRATNIWTKLLLDRIEGYKRDIAINPNAALNYLEIGKCYKYLGEWFEAEVWYDLYLDKTEASADEILRYAEILAKNNHIAKGLPILKLYTEKYPTDHRLMTEYGYFLLWLGKTKQATEIFTKALEIRPYFKEALNGLDLAKGKGYIYSINDTTSRFNYGINSNLKEYAIDKYYRLIKKNPADDETRFKLIESLIKVNRFEEAIQQLNYLSSKYSSQKRYTDLYQKVISLRNSYYKERIKYFEDLLNTNPDNKNALLELAKYYSYDEDYISALRIYKNYLIKFPQDTAVRFKLVQILIWQNDLCEAQKESNILLKENPDNSDYQLMAANINLWLDDNLDESKILFQKVLEKNPSNVEALSGLANLEIKNENYSNAEMLITQLDSVDKSYSGLLHLKNSLNRLREIKENEKLSKILNDARNYTAEGDYESAIKLFNQYLSKVGSDKNVSLELADVYLKLSDVKDAISIYDKLLLNNYDYDIAKQRAKVVFWEGDSLTAIKDFKKLVQKNPNDIEAKLFLGDAYLKTGQTQNARKIYEELLAQSPTSYILKTRLNWLGGSDKFSLENFPSYLQAIPQGYYFTDNTDFKLSNVSLGLDFGITKFLSLGVSGSRGSLFSADGNLRFNQVKGTAYLKLNEIINGVISFGQTYFANDKQEGIVEINLSAKKKNVYSIIAYLNYSDAAFILYSPLLVNTRLNAYYYGINADYRFNNNFVISGKYAYLEISDKNNGNQLQARIGKIFESDFTAGYEYYYYTFNKITPVYWSPDNFESHSFWADWNLYKDEITAFILGGKVGIIPQNDFVLSEFYASFSYKISNTILLNAKFTTGSSSRSNVGYRSTAFQAGLFLNI